MDQKQLLQLSENEYAFNKVIFLKQLLIKGDPKRKLRKPEFFCLRFPLKAGDSYEIKKEKKQTDKKRTVFRAPAASGSLCIGANFVFRY